MKGDTLSILDNTDCEFQKNRNNAIYWQSYNESSGEFIYSIPKFVEEHAEELRSKYLALIYEFGVVKVFYNHCRFYQTLDYKKPMNVYQESIKLNQNNKRAS